MATLHAENFAELMSGPTEVEWVVEQLIPNRTSGMIAGDSGLGKTWLTLDLALAIATGEKWLGQFPTERGTVLVVDEENNSILLRNRLSKMLHGRGLDPRAVPVFFMVGQAVDLSPKENRDGSQEASGKMLELKGVINKVNPKLVIFDSLRRVHHKNENDSNEMSGVFAQVKQLVDETGVSTLFNHHINKANGLGNGGFRIRGSTDIRAFCDYTLMVDRATEGKALIITHDKSRWGEEVDPFLLNLVITDESFNIERMEIVRKADLTDWLVNELVKGEISRQDLVARGTAAGYSRSSITSRLGALVEADRVTRTQRGHERIYAITPILDAEETK